MNKSQAKILICAGGTGGHIIPALAIASELTAKQYCQVHWLGTKAGLESGLVVQAGFPISYISINGLRGKHWLACFIAPIKIIVAILQSVKILLQLKPNLVLGMGGFVTGPSGIAAKLLRIPLIIHEQNAIAGTTNAILTHFANKTLEGFPHTFPANKRVQYTGNPVRTQFSNLIPPTLRVTNGSATKLKVLVVGGSRGALALNKCIPAALQLLPAFSVEAWHQTGEKHLAQTLEFYKQAQITARVVPFIEDIASAYAWADVVICRSGAMTIAELAAAGVASILVPFPYAIDDHQTENAKYLSDAGAAILVPQIDLMPERLANMLQDFMTNRSKLIAMAKAAYKLANLTALDNVVEQCLEQLNTSIKQ